MLQGGERFGRELAGVRDRFSTTPVCTGSPTRARFFGRIRVTVRGGLLPAIGVAGSSLAR